MFYDANHGFRLPRERCLPPTCLIPEPAIGLNGAGKTYGIGVFRGTLAFDPDDTNGDGDTEMRHSSDSAPFLASYTGCGTFRFVHVFGVLHSTDSSGAMRYRVAVDAENRVCLAGQIVGIIAFDPEDTNGDGDLAQRTSSGNGDAFLAGYTSEGVFRFVTIAAGGTGSNRDLATLPSGISFVTGTFTGTADFDPSDGADLHNGRGQTNLFLARYTAGKLPVAAETTEVRSTDPFFLATPNPFSASTMLHLTVPQRQRVRVSIYDTMGWRGALLFDGMLEVQQSQ